MKSSSGRARSGGDVFDHVGDLTIGHRRPQNRAQLGVLVGAAAEGHLVVLLAVFLDAKDADVTDVMVATGIDAPGDIDVQPAEIAREIETAEAA